MKKLFISIILLISITVFAFTEELNGFMDIDFLTKKSKTISELQSKNWSIVESEDNSCIMSNANGEFLGLQTDIIVLLFNDDRFISGTAIMPLSGSNQTKIETLIPSFQEMYNTEQPVFTNGDDQSTVIFNLKNKNTILFIMTYGKCSISFSYSNETLDTNILNTELLDTSYLIDKPLECNYLSFVYKYQFFKDGTFIIAISGNNVDGMATGVYSIQDNYAYLTTKSYLGKNVNLIIRKDECYEIKSLTKNSVILENIEPIDKVFGVPLSFVIKD